MVTIDNFKNSTKSSTTKHCNSKELRVVRNFLQNVFFYFTNLSQGSLLYSPWFFILKFLILPVLLLKWNKTCCIEFSLIKISVSFIKLINISLDDDREWGEKTIAVLLSRMIKNKLFRVTATIQLRNFNLKNE